MKVTKTIKEDPRVRTLLRADSIVKILNKRLLKDLRVNDHNVIFSAWLHALSFVSASIICRISEEQHDNDHKILNGFIDLMKSHISEFTDTEKENN